MRLLVIGGTLFVGRHVVLAARARGWDVTLANRGRTAPGAFPDLPLLRIDREARDLAALADVEADAVIDTSAYRPHVVRDLLAALGPRAGWYCLVSTGSVYADPVPPDGDESAPRVTLPPDVDAATVPIAERYGELKAACEDVALAADVPAMIVRPGLIVGPDDPTDRFTYWPRRLARGGRVLCPEPDQPVQVLDVRDLAAFLCDLAAARATGIAGAVGPAERTTFSDVVATCAAVAAERGAPPAEPVWAGEEALVAAGVEPWMGLPLYLPRADWTFLGVSNAHGRNLGLAPRPLAETVAATLDWDATRPPGERRDLLAPEREAEVLAGLA